MARGFQIVGDRFVQLCRLGPLLPIKADGGSAGNDFYALDTKVISPGDTTIFITNVKAYMEPDEVLMMFVRSSIGIKRRLMLGNGTGIIDSSYYNNPDNDGNILIALHNYGDLPVTIQAGERIAQGIFVKYLNADAYTTMADSRIGGLGSSGA